MNQFDKKFFYNNFFYNNYNFTKKNLSINLNSLSIKFLLYTFKFDFFKCFYILQKIKKKNFTFLSFFSKKFKKFNKT